MSASNHELPLSGASGGNSDAGSYGSYIPRYSSNCSISHSFLRTLAYMKFCQPSIHMRLTSSRIVLNCAPNLLRIPLRGTERHGPSPKPRVTFLPISWSARQSSSVTGLSHLRLDGFASHPASALAVCSLLQYVLHPFRLLVIDITFPAILRPWTHRSCFCLPLTVPIFSVSHSLHSLIFPLLDTLVSIPTGARTTYKIIDINPSPSSGAEPTPRTTSARVLWGPSNAAAEIPPSRLLCFVAIARKDVSYTLEMRADEL